jgi:ADP-ribose pyrophosphatase
MAKNEKQKVAVGAASSKAKRAKKRRAMKAKGQKAVRKSKPQKKAKGFKAEVAAEKARLISSKVVFEIPLFRIQHDKLIEPGGLVSERDVIRHNGSVVILAIDKSQSKKNPWIVMERQYRHAANGFLWELPAGKIDAGEEPLAAAKRELMEETGYSARSWKPLVDYWASPGFLGESMKVFLAEGLIAGEAQPEEDEKIDFRLVKLSDVVKMIKKGGIHDGKTLVSILLYMQKNSRKSKR